MIVNLTAHSFHLLCDPSRQFGIAAGAQPFCFLRQDR